MEELKSLVLRAQSGSVDAFALLVHRFQDMAVGYAYTLLRDFHLAEDAAQEAFVGAYLELSRLREPAAFAGWLRRLVFMRCTRVRRGKRLEVVPLDLAAQIAAPLPDPLECLVAGELSAQVGQAIKVLAEPDRQVVALFYISNYSHAEIAAFLEVPESTVKKRLHDARKRLKKGMIAMVKERLNEQAPSRSGGFARKVLAGILPEPGDSTVIGTFYPMLKAAGADCTVPRLAGIFGHAFSFMMKKGGAEVWQQANIEWWLFFDRMPQLGYHFQHFQAILKGKVPVPTPEQLQKLKDQTWEVVRESIDRGVPAIAWSPLTLEQKKQGIYGFEWSLLLGYDEADKTYVVRNQHYQAEFSVPYDQFGYTDRVNWYYVIVLGAPQPVDPEQVAVQSLQQAVEFAQGRRFKLEDACYAVDAQGFAAYELWQEAFRTGTVDARFAPDHARQLRWLRAQAAAYLREISAVVPGRSRPTLAQAAACYDAEVEVLAELEALCRQGAGAGAFSPAMAQEAVNHLDKALGAERRAIEHLEGVAGR
jgi:RNA polymerase sigma factor (sigma-70 family)